MVLKSKKKMAVAVASAALFVALAPIEAMAGADATFGTIKTNLTTWIQGSGGIAVSLAAIGIGGVASVAKQSPLPILGGVGSAILMQYSPDVVNAVITATI